MSDSTNPVPPLTANLARLAARLLHTAGNEFGNHGCNDFDLTKVPGFETREARAALDLAKHTWNGDPEEHDPDHDHRYGYDWSLMHFLGDVLDAAAGDPASKDATEKRTIDLQRATSAAQDAALSATATVREYQAAKTRAEARIGALRRELNALEALLAR